MKTKHPTVALTGAAILLAILGTVPAARAYTHPCLPLNSADLTQLNANKNTAPWLTGLTALNSSGESHSKLTYVMQGPCVEVGRTPDVNRNAFANDMKAIQCLAMEWKLTGNSAYADLARTILLAWANTHTTWSGAESYLDTSDYISRVMLGASILRSYSGWSAADTTTVKNYFNNVWWDQSGIPGPLRSANQGAGLLKIAFGVAGYCDDTVEMSQAVAAFRADACGGLANSLPNGQIGDTGRDQGHAYGELWNLSWCAEVAWKAAGIDLFGLLNNRLMAAGEYFSNFNNGGSPSFIQAGTCYGLYPTIGGTPTTTVSPEALDILQGAYVLRKGQSMPLLTAYRAITTYNYESWFYRKSSDSSTAVMPTDDITYASVTSATSLTNATIGTASPAGSSSYSGGTWTVSGSGSDIWGNADSCHFAYKTTTGDCAIVAKVTSVQNTNASAKVGVMIRESLAANSKIVAIYLMPTLGTQSEIRGQTSSDNNVTSQTHTPGTVPYWVKLVRSGNVIVAYDSPDGTNWTPNITVYFASFSSSAYIGLCVTSHANGTMNTSTFTNVSIGTGGTLVNRATAGTVTTSSENAPNESAAKAFDGSTSTKWYNFFGTTPSPTGWLQYQFGQGNTAYPVIQYKLTSANDVPQRDPKNWQFQGSNDGTNWTTLDTQSNQTFAARFQTNTYSISNPTAYQYYRLNITANSGGSAYGLQLSEFSLMAY